MTSQMSPSVNNSHQYDPVELRHPGRTKINWLKARMFVLTFLAYAIYSGTRQPFGITKSSLNPDHKKDPNAGPGYAPFNDQQWGSTYLGALDTVFYSFYAIGLFITGPLGDRLNLRWFLSIGMILSGAFCFLFGLGGFLSIHTLVWFIGCNIFAGLFQATGWPSTVTLMTRWFGQGNRGTIMGVWNAQSSVGNIIGKFWSTLWLNLYGWEYAFMGTGALCMFVAFMQMAFVVPHPHDVLNESELMELERLNSQGHIAKVSVLSKEDEEREQLEKLALAAQRNNNSIGSDGSSSPSDDGQADEVRRLTGMASASPTTVSILPDGSVVQSPPAPQRQKHHDEYESISFCKALTVPGVLEYSACLFFSKLVAYAFTSWLPFYLTNLNYSDAAAGNLSTVYDMGGVAGGVLAGWASDYTGKRGLVSVTMLLLCLPGLWIYNFLASYGLAWNVILMFIAGILVNGPYTLISGVVAADLGNHPSLKGNPKAMSTVTGIIDGSGSVGAAIQGVTIGIVGKQLGWTNVFYMLEGFCCLAALCLFRIMRKELGPVSTWRSFGEICSGRTIIDNGQDTPQLKHDLSHSYSGEDIPAGGGGRLNVRNFQSTSSPEDDGGDVRLKKSLKHREGRKLSDEREPLSPNTRRSSDLHDPLMDGDQHTR